MSTPRTLPAGSRPASRPAVARRRGGPPARVRWDRLGRLAMLLVLFVLVYLYVSPVRSLFSTIHQSTAERAALAGLERTNKQLLAERAALGSPSTIELDARKQGMVEPGEKEFVVSGLPGN